MSLDRGSAPESALDFVRICRWNDNCTLIHAHDGCSTCAFTRGPRDKESTTADLLGFPHKWKPRHQRYRLEGKPDDQ